MYIRLGPTAPVSLALGIQKTGSSHVLSGNISFFFLKWDYFSIYQCHSWHLHVRSLQGIRITQAAVGSRRTMLVSDTGRVYAFGKDSFRGAETVEPAHTTQITITTPKIVVSLKGVFVVQAVIGGYFSAVLSREGRVYTFSWGKSERLGHNSEPSDVEPRLLSELEDVPVAYISAGNCYLLMLAYQPNGM